MIHSHLKAVSIANEMVFRSAIVEAKHLFVYVTEQMERLNRNVRAFQSALEQAPEILKAVCVDLPLNVTFCMVNRLVNEVLVIQSLIGQEGIGVDRALGRDVSTDFRLQVMLTPRGNDVRVNLSAAFQNADNGCLIFYSAFRNHALAPCRVHESSGTTNKSLVYFHFATRTAKFYKVLVMHCETNAVHHEPCRLLSDAQSPGDFIGTDSVLGVHNEPNGNHPLVHAKCGILEDRTNLNGELFLAALAEPMAARRDKRMFRSLAAWARYLVVRPPQLYRVIERALRVTEICDGFLQRLGKRECVCHA